MSYSIVMKNRIIASRVAVVVVVVVVVVFVVVVVVAIEFPPDAADATIDVETRAVAFVGASVSAIFTR